MKTPFVPLPPIVGSLRPVRLLGRGGMGEVWLCRDDALGVDRAVKLLLPERAGDAALRARFAAEARILASLGEAPGIVRVHSAGEDPATRRPYFVMDAHLLPPERIRDICTRRLGLPPAAADAIVSRAEFAESAAAPFTLQDALGNEAAGTARQLPERAVLALAREIAAALSFLHGRAPPVVHRDIKPSNLLFAADGRLLLADFGVARTLDAARAELTRPGFQPGTQRYAAPELLRGDPATPAADWYALGVVLFRALTSSFPQWGESFPTREGLRSFSPLWEPLLRDLLAPDPARRLAYHAAFSRRLDTLEKALDRPRGGRRHAKVSAAAAALAAIALLGAGIAAFRHAENAGGKTHAEFAESAENPGGDPGVAEPPPVESHAESAESAEVEAHAESAESAEVEAHAESAESAEVEAHTEIAESAEVEAHTEIAESAEVEARAEIAESAEVEARAESAESAEHPEGVAGEAEPVEPDIQADAAAAIADMGLRRAPEALEHERRLARERALLLPAKMEALYNAYKRNGEILPLHLRLLNVSQEEWEEWLARKLAEEGSVRKIPPAAPEPETEEPEP